MFILRIRDIRADEYRALYKHMRRDFPQSELPPFFVIKSNLKKKTGSGLFLVEEPSADNNLVSEKILGYAIITAPENTESALLLFFAILPEYRSSGRGGEFLKLIGGFYPVLTLEAEDPAAAKTNELSEMAHRRVRFYERSGFRALPTARAKIFGVDMLIMTNVLYEVESARELMHSLYSGYLSSEKLLRFIDVQDLF